jgi:serine/threonine protein kinase
MDYVDEINAKLIDFEDLKLNNIDASLILAVQAKLKGIKIRFLPIERGLSGTMKFVIKPDTLFPLLAKIGNIKEIRQEVEGDKLLRLRVPPLNIPPFFMYREKNDRAILVYRYITGGRVIDLVDRLDVYLGSFTSKGPADLFEEIFDTVLKKCHWLDGKFKINPIKLPELEDPENGIDPTIWGKIASIYSNTKSKVKSVVAPYGITHGDLHPKNILLTRDRTPVIIDFAFSKQNSCIYIDYAKLEVLLQFQIQSKVTEEFERVRNRVYSSEPLILPRSLAPLAVYLSYPLNPMEKLY